MSGLTYHPITDDLDREAPARLIHRYLGIGTDRTVCGITVANVVSGLGLRSTDHDCPTCHPATAKDFA